MHYFLSLPLILRGQSWLLQGKTNEVLVFFAWLSPGHSRRWRLAAMWRWRGRWRDGDGISCEGFSSDTGHKSSCRPGARMHLPSSKRLTCWSDIPPDKFHQIFTCFIIILAGRSSFSFSSLSWRLGVIDDSDWWSCCSGMTSWSVTVAPQVIGQIVSDLNPRGLFCDMKIITKGDMQPPLYIQRIPSHNFFLPFYFFSKKRFCWLMLNKRSKKKKSFLRVKSIYLVIKRFACFIFPIFDKDSNYSNRYTYLILTIHNSLITRYKLFFTLKNFFFF